MFEDMAEISPTLDQELRILNKDIGANEQAGEVKFFDELLATNFIFRRADGSIVDKHQYLDSLKLIEENPYEQLDAVIEQVTLNKESAVAEVIVIAKRKSMKRSAAFRNVRVFRRESENWKLVMWVNTELGDVF